MKINLYLGQDQLLIMGRFERMYGGRDARKEWRNAHKSETSAYNSAYYKQNYDTKIKPRRDVQRVANRKNPILGF